MIDSLLSHLEKKKKEGELRIYTGKYGALNGDFDPDALEERKLRPRPEESISGLQPQELKAKYVRDHSNALLWECIGDMIGGRKDIRKQGRGEKSKVFHSDNYAIKNCMRDIF